MITRLIHPVTKLDKAIVASVAAMLAMNLFVLSHQLQPAQTAAHTSAVAAQQA